MASEEDQKYRRQERDFIEDLVVDLFDMVKQDPLRLYGYMTQQIIGVLVSPVWNIYEATAALPNDENRSQAEHIWQTVVRRVAQFCAETEPHHTGREQVDWVLLRLYQDLFTAISSRVISARGLQAPDRI